MRPYIGWMGCLLMLLRSGISTSVICRLDSSACQEHGGISSLFMRVMDACGEELQRDILSVLPELLNETNHEVYSAPAGMNALRLARSLL